MRIYLAGPMRGKPDLNFKAFDEAKIQWTQAGHQVFSPADLDRALGYGMYGEESIQNLKHVMMNDINCLYNADAIALLPGWEDSMGATVELALAQMLGLDIYDAETMAQFSPNKKPWLELLVHYKELSIGV